MNKEFFDTVKAEVDLLDYLVEHCNFDWGEDTGGKYKGQCPFHDERSASFYVWPEQDGWRTYHCFGCSRSGTVIDAVMEQEGFLDASEAVLWLNSEYELGLEYDEAGLAAWRERMETNRATISKAKAALNDVDDRVSKEAQRYLQQGRGLSDKTIEDFDLGLDTERVQSGRILIPFKDKAGADITNVFRALFDGAKCRNPACRLYIPAKDIYNARTEYTHEVRNGVDESTLKHWGSCPECGAPPDVSKLKWLSRQHPKYMFESGFNAREHLYNEHRARKSVAKDRENQLGICIVEGYGDVWALHQAGFHASVAYSGSTFKPEQIHKIVELYALSGHELSVILVPDFDETGMQKAPENIRKIWAVDPTVQLRIVKELPDRPDGTPCKDMGDVLKALGVEGVQKTMQENVVSAYHWLIDRTLTRQRKDGSGLRYDREQQTRLIAEVLHTVRYPIEIEPIIQDMQLAWDGMPETQIRLFVNSEIKGQASGSTMHLMATIQDSHKAAYEYLKDKFVIRHGFKTIDTELPGGGARLRQLAMFIGKSGTGKAQPLDSKVLTPSGWRRMGDLAVGDLVMDPAGGTACVSEIFPQGARPVYRVHFSDGTSAECDIDHLWQVRKGTKDPESAPWTTRSLREIIEHTDLARQPLWIPMADAVEWDEAELEADPYELGCMLADTTRARVGGSVAVKVPAQYLRASVRQRIALLQGVMDTCGEIAGRGHVQLTLADEQLTADMRQLVQSLGGTARLRPSGQLHIALPRAVKPFKDSPNARRYRAKAAQPARRMIAAEYVGVKPTQCLSLSSANHLYITDDFITTHNTMLSLQILMNMARQGLRCVFFSLEMPRAQIYLRMVTQVLGINRFEAEELVETQDERLNEVDDLYGQLVIIDNVPAEATDNVPDMTPGMILRTVNDLNLLHFTQPVQVVCIDHLGQMSIDFETAPKDVASSDMMIPGFVMQELAKITKAMNIYMMVLNQLPKGVPEGVEFPFDAGRGGSKQTDNCDYIYCIWRPDREHGIDPDEIVLRRGQYRLRLSKNRHGASVTAYLKFEGETGRIVPDPEYAMPFDGVDEAISTNVDDDMFADAGATASSRPASVDHGMPVLPIQMPAEPPEGGAEASVVQGLLDGSVKPAEPAQQPVEPVSTEAGEGETAPDAEIVEQRPVEAEMSEEEQQLLQKAEENVSEFMAGWLEN